MNICADISYYDSQSIRFLVDHEVCILHFVLQHQGIYQQFNAIFEQGAW